MEGERCSILPLYYFVVYLLLIYSNIHTNTSVSLDYGLFGQARIL